MSHIALVRKRDLLLEKITNILQECGQGTTVKNYSEEDYEHLYEQRDLHDVLIIDQQMNIEAQTLIDYYQDHEKKVIVWCSSTNEEELTKLFRLRLSGYFHNEMETEEIMYAMESILTGGQYIHPKLTPFLLKDYGKVAGKQPKPIDLLTRREWQVLGLIVKGEKNCNIGKLLRISEKTVDNHVAAILRKLDVPDRTNAALYALKKRWYIL